jgi:hypothetical protein
MTAEELIAQIEGLIAEYRVPPVPIPTIPTVTPGQPYPDGMFQLVAGETYGPLVFRSGMHVIGNGAMINGGAQPAIYAPPSTGNIFAENLLLGSTHQSVALLGDNSATTQNSLAQVPTGITLNNLQIPMHRGKRGIEVNATNVVINNPVILDVWSSSAVDSQAICVLNTPGNVMVNGGRLSAGSEVMMIGGDTMKLANTVINNVTVQNTELFRPLSWKTDGVNRVVKNLFEVKAGTDILIRDCILDGCWASAQDGWAFVITPKNSQYIQNVTVRDCTVRNAAGLVQLLGKDYNSVTPQATRFINFENVNFAVSKITHGGRGIPALMVGGMQDFSMTNCTGTFDGYCIISSDSNATYGQHGPVTITGCNMPTGNYGLMADGANYGDPLPAGSSYTGQELLVSITGNTFTGAPTRFRTNFPTNTYL